ncbi:MAG: hypothetical protein KUG83_09665 [Gammaproteobacteria bacterium]|nr:hypothetical protein [Gammaproteobacteria bacterium]
MQVNNAITGVVLPRISEERSRHFNGRVNADFDAASKKGGHEAEYRYAKQSERSATEYETRRPINAVNRSEPAEPRTAFKRLNTQHLSSQGRAAVFAYSGVAEALAPQKIELLGIDVFV